MIPAASTRTLTSLSEVLDVPAHERPASDDGLVAVRAALERAALVHDEGSGSHRSSRASAADDMYRRGVDALRDGSDADACRDLARSVALDPGRTACHLHLAVARFRTGDVVGAYESLGETVRTARPGTAPLAAGAALVASRLALAAGSRAAAVEVLTAADQLADCQAVVEALVRLVPERDLRLLELVVAHGAAIEPFDPALLGPRGERFESALRASVEVALEHRSDLLVAASQLRSRFRALAADEPPGSARATTFEHLAARLYEAFLALHDAPRPTRTAAPSLGRAAGEARRLADVLREALPVVHEAQSTAELVDALSAERPGGGGARRDHRRGRRRRRAARRERAEANVTCIPGPPAPAADEGTAPTVVDLERGHAAVAGLRHALDLVPVRPAELVRPAMVLEG